jgi:putative secretion ATPase (PEP-CTERM system associated)
MYEAFFELRERPFALSPDPEYFFPSRVHREALDHLRYGLQSQAGFALVTGEIGSGKTLLLQTLLRGLDSKTAVARVVDTRLEPRELLEAIMIDFGLEPIGRSKPLLLRDLSQYLVDRRFAGRMALLVIDEAQNLSLDALEELRMLSNLETEKSKLLQIMLVGQGSLRDQLDAPDLEQLRQRITVSYHLQPLDAAETAGYINHRLRRAATGAPLQFPPEATEAIHARSGGLPRIINVICDAALLFGYAEDRRTIDRALVREVFDELELTGVLPAGGGQRTAVTPPRNVAEPVRAAALAPPPIAAPSATSGASPVEATGTSAVSDPDLDVFDSEAAVGQVVLAHVETRAVSPQLHELSLRAAELDRREAAVRQRERELTDQRRVLAEEYRLLRSGTAAAPRSHNRTQPVRLQVEAPLGAEPESAGSLWRRMKQTVLGASTPTLE